MKLSHHRDLIFFFSSLGWNYGANVAKSNDEERSRLKKEVDPEVIATKHYIIDTAVDKVQSNKQLQQLNPKGNRENKQNPNKIRNITSCCSAVCSQYANLSKTRC